MENLQEILKIFLSDAWEIPPGVFPEIHQEFLRKFLYPRIAAGPPLGVTPGIFQEISPEASSGLPIAVPPGIPMGISSELSCITPGISTMSSSENFTNSCSRDSPRSCSCNILLAVSFGSFFAGIF